MKRKAARKAAKMGSDKVEKLGNSLIQYGPHNSRIYAMKVYPEDLSGLLPKMDSMAREMGFGKVFAKVAKSCLASFLAGGYEQEARIPNFYRGEEDAFFLGKYITPERKYCQNEQELQEILTLAKKKGQKSREDESKRELGTSFRLELLDKSKAKEITELYKRVFETYPFPIHDDSYIASTMDENFSYYGVFDDEAEGRLAAVSSAEMDQEGLNAEMTDFATDPTYRGKGLASHLLSKMEADMAHRGYKTLFTIARAVSPGMNISFAKAGYHFAGRLRNNTNIGGSIESMNVWYKTIPSNHSS